MWSFKTDIGLHNASFELEHTLPKRNKCEREKRAGSLSRAICQLPIQVNQDPLSLSVHPLRHTSVRCWIHSAVRMDSATN